MSLTKIVGDTVSIFVVDQDSKIECNEELKCAEIANVKWGV